MKFAQVAEESCFEDSRCQNIKRADDFVFTIEDPTQRIVDICHPTTFRSGHRTRVAGKICLNTESNLIRSIAVEFGSEKVIF
jgi:hypothetical protein